ncbi:MAG: glutaredoxin [Deltaproteobacteria bacterium]|nr:glutaredoxin [Deltaproteobacteria bacterium]
MQPVKIYTSDWCGFCTAAKHLLKTRGVAFEEIDTTGNDDLRAWLRQTTGRRTVPQIFIGERAIGGYEELRMLDTEGKLAALVAGEGA